MRIDIDERPTASVLIVHGRMDATSVEIFEEACRAQISAGAAKVVIHLGNLEYISSAGLRGILSMEKQSRASGTTLVFCAMQAMVADMFELSGFNSILAICPSLEEALA